MRSSRSMMPGAASHMSLMGGWFPRKSPPLTVSSMLPGRFAFALPIFCGIDSPRARQCDRFTGRMENGSTFAPISAVLMTAANPGETAAYHDHSGSCHLIAPGLSCAVVWDLRERNVAPFGDTAQRPRPNVYRFANPARKTREQRPCRHLTALLRFVARHNPPLRAEQPDAVGEDAGSGRPVPPRRKTWCGVIAVSDLPDNTIGYSSTSIPVEQPWCRCASDLNESDPAGPALDGLRPVPDQG